MSVINKMIRVEPLNYDVESSEDSLLLESFIRFNSGQRSQELLSYAVELFRESLNRVRK